MDIHVIMPMRSDPRMQKKIEVINNVAQRYGIIAHSPNYNLNKPVFDLASTISDMKNASFILADLSLERPSCYYELGLAEALGKEVYVVAEENSVKFSNFKDLDKVISEVIGTAIQIRRDHS